MHSSSCPRLWLIKRKGGVTSKQPWKLVRFPVALRPGTVYRTGMAKTEEEQGAAFDPARVLKDSAAQPRVRSLLESMASDPPQVLILEGGSEISRTHMALFWGAALNCREPDPPCCQCTVCPQFLMHAHRDLFLFLGARESIKIDQIRALRPQLGEPPRSARFRVVLFTEAQHLTTESANALLKSLEEPTPWTRFVLTAPQRERLLPTLVSRGWVLTLSWNQSGSSSESDPETVQAVNEWADALLGFLDNGRGWMQRTLAKGSLTKALAARILVRCQADLAAVLAGRQGGNLARGVFQRLDPVRLREIDLSLAAAHDSLDSGANPALVMDWIAGKLFVLIRKR